MAGSKFSAPPTAPLRVISLVDTVAFAGTERHVLDLTRALHTLAENAEAEYSCAVTVAIACPPDSPLAAKARALNLTTLPLPPHHSSLPNFRALRLLRRWLRAGRFDILHAHGGSTALHAVLSVTL